jgi:hypothetical protein
MPERERERERAYRLNTVKEALGIRISIGNTKLGMKIVHPKSPGVEERPSLSSSNWGTHLNLQMHIS